MGFFDRFRRTTNTRTNDPVSIQGSIVTTPDVSINKKPEEIERELYLKQLEMEKERVWQEIKTQGEREGDNYHKIKTLLDGIKSQSILEYYWNYYHHFTDQLSQFNPAFERYVIEDLYPFHLGSIQHQVSSLETIVRLIEGGHTNLLRNYWDKYNIDDGPELEIFMELLESKGISTDKISLQSIIFLFHIDDLIQHTFNVVRNAPKINGEDAVRRYVRAFCQEFKPLMDYDKRFTVLRWFLWYQGISIPNWEIEGLVRQQMLEDYERELMRENKNKISVDFDNLNGYEFEDLLVDIFNQAGYEVKHTPYSNDMGADLLIKNGFEVTVIQAKHTDLVGPSAVQEVVAAMKFYGGSKCLVITSGNYTKSARDLADANHVVLWGRDELINFIQKLK